MKNALRALSGLSAVAISAPAFAHHQGEHADAVQSAAHWLTDPVHMLPVLAIVALAGYIVYSRRQRGQGE